MQVHTAPNELSYFSSYNREGKKLSAIRLTSSATISIYFNLCFAAVFNKDEVMTERIMVTGGAGFIGSYLCTALINLGHKVLCVDNLSSGMFRIRVRSFRGQLTWGIRKRCK